MTAPLRRALAGLSVEDLAASGRALLAGVDALMGSDRRHAPLFARFPAETAYQPAYERYTSVVAEHLAAQPHQPCMNCASATARVRALAPCAHLLCDDCLGAKKVPWNCCDQCCEWYECPVCDRRYETDGPTEPWLATGTGPGGDGGPVLRALRLGAPGDAAAELAALLARRTPLNRQDHDDLVLLLGHLDPAAAADWLPPAVPLRESKALALAPLLDLPAVRAAGRRGTRTPPPTCCASSSYGPGATPTCSNCRACAGSRVPCAVELLGLLDGFDLRRLAEDMAPQPARLEAGR